MSSRIEQVRHEKAIAAAIRAAADDNFFVYISYDDHPWQNEDVIICRDKDEYLAGTEKRAAEREQLRKLRALVPEETPHDDEPIQPRLG